MNMKSTVEAQLDQVEEERLLAEKLWASLPELKDNFQPLIDAPTSKMRQSLLEGFISAFPELAGKKYSDIKRVIKHMEEMSDKAASKQGAVANLVNLNKVEPVIEPGLDSTLDKEARDKDTGVGVNEPLVFQTGDQITFDISNPDSEPVVLRKDITVDQSELEAGANLIAPPEVVDPSVEAAINNIVDAGLDDLGRVSAEQDIIESAAAEDLKDNPDFVKAAENIDAEKAEVVAKAGINLKSLLNQTGAWSTKVLNKVGDFFNLKKHWREAAAAVERKMILEEEKKISQNPLKQEFYNNMAPEVKEIFRYYLAKVEDEDLDTGRIFKNIRSEEDNAVKFYYSGFYNRLNNQEECYEDQGEGKNKKTIINIASLKARYDLVSPQGEVLLKDVYYFEANDELHRLAQEYHKEKVELVAARPTETPAVEAEENLNPGAASPASLDEVTPEPEVVANTEPNPEPILEPVSPEPVGLVAPENKPETEPQTIIEKELASLNISPEEMEQIYGFNRLEEGQQYLVLQNLKQVLVGDIKAAAINQYKLEVAESGWLGRKFKPALKNYYLARFEKEAAAEIKSKGLEKNQDYLTSLTRAMYFSGPDIELKEEKGEVKWEADFFKAPSYFGAEGQAMAEKYNQAASAFSKIPQEWGLESVGLRKGYSQGKKNYEWYRQAEADYEHQEHYLLDFLYKQAEFSGLSKQQTDSDILQKINNCRAQIETQRFMATVPDAEDALSGMRERTAWKAMLTSGLGARGGYAAGGFVMRSLMIGRVAVWSIPTAGIAISSALAIPLTGAAVGGLRGWNQGRKELKEKDWLARRGQKDAGKTAANFVEVGWSEATRAEDGTVLKSSKAGLDLKLDELISKVQRSEHSPIFEDRPVRDEKGRLVMAEEVSGGPVFSILGRDENDRHNRLIHSLGARPDNDGQPKLQVLKETVELKREDLLKALRERLEYTEDKVSEGRVNFGSGVERLRNQAELAKMIGTARAILEIERDPNSPDSSLYYAGATDVQRRLFGILNLRERKISKERKKHLVKVAAQGAVVGAAFAFAGSKLAEWAWGQIGSHQGASGGAKSEAAQSASTSQEQIVTTKAAAGGLSEAEKFAQAQANYDKLSQAGGVGGLSQDKILETIYQNDQAAQNSWVEQTPVSSEADYQGGSAEVPTDQIPAGRGGAGKIAETVAASKTSGATPTGGTNFEDEISNRGLAEGAHDSVWRSAKEIFMNHAKTLGYKGDLSDSDTLNNWAEVQAAKAVNNSDALTDKVFEGNRVILEQDGGAYHLRVDQGSGHEPGMIENQSAGAKLNPVDQSGGKSTGAPYSADEASQPNYNIYPEQPATPTNDLIGQGAETPNVPGGTEAYPYNFPQQFLDQNKVTGDLTQMDLMDYVGLLQKYQQELGLKTDKIMDDITSDHARGFFKHLKEIKGERLTRSERNLWQQFLDDYSQTADKSSIIRAMNDKVKNALEVLMRK